MPDIGADNRSIPTLKMVLVSGLVVGDHWLTPNIFSSLF